ncbi:hypothetical protein PRZ03_15645 [Paucibacter sp. hw8]|uniref:Uncharacterized protein n=1 Tax=Roseateles albus TaxID=2987525 RepID=A0ABT5KGN2_9BURK|nr:hypothetical protein [Roseateles albus]
MAIHVERGQAEATIKGGIEILELPNQTFNLAIAATVHDLLY